MRHRTLWILLVLCVGSAGLAPAEAIGANGSTVVAQAQGTRSGTLEPRYEPAPVADPDAYDNQYVFAMSRGVADAAIAPYGKLPLYVLSVPLDLAFLPFALIGGLF